MTETRNLVTDAEAVRLRHDYYGMGGCESDDLSQHSTGDIMNDYDIVREPLGRVTDPSYAGLVHEALAALSRIKAQEQELRKTQGGMEFTARLERYERALRELLFWMADQDEGLLSLTAELRDDLMRFYEPEKGWPPHIESARNLGDFEQAVSIARAALSEPTQGELPSREELMEQGSRYTNPAPQGEREMWRIAHKVSHFGPAWGQRLPPECPFCFPDPQERLVTDEEAMFLHDHVENDVVQALLDTREALIRALEREHKDSRCPCYYGMGGCESDALLATLRGEAPEGSSPFRDVTDDLTGGDGCACHTGIGHNTSCVHCEPSQGEPRDV